MKSVIFQKIIIATTIVKKYGFKKLKIPTSSVVHRKIRKSASKVPGNPFQTMTFAKIVKIAEIAKIYKIEKKTTIPNFVFLVYKV